MAGIVIPSDTNLSDLNQDIYLDFSGALVGDNLTFTQVTFGDNSKFSQTTFSAGATFSKCKFGKDTDFSNSMFCDETDFCESRFGDFSTFDQAILDKHFTFEKTIFGNNTKFRKTKFRCSVGFFKATFGNFTTFQSAEFHPNANFDGTKFGNNTIFVDTVFDWGTMFRFSFFAGRVSFKVLTASKDVTEKINFSIIFNNAVFNNNVDFSGRHFIGKTDFRGAIFHGLAKFYGAELSEETYFTLDDAHWPLPPKPKGRAEKNSDCDTSAEETPSPRFEEYEKAFCRLKKIQLGHEARTAEHFFYKLELKARMRRSDIRWTEKFAAGTYGLFSDYGESIGRPLAWLLVSFLIATAVTCCAALPFWQDFAPDNLGFAATAAWHNLIPGEFVKDVFSACHDEACRSYRYGEWSDHLLTAYGFWLYFVTGIFVAGNLALWFLFGLALKRRFQIK